MTATVRDLAAALRADRRGDAVLVDATHDSHQVGPGTLFCAIRGERSDGHAHAQDAVAAGAAALLVDHWLPLEVAQVRVADTRAAAGPAAAVVHGDPTAELAVVGVTGTNGKTTTTWMIESAVAAGGRGTGLIGTVETRIDGEAVAGVRTTPEGPDLQRLFARMRARDVAVVAMEVSSHGLDLRRIDGTHVDVAVFTNLSQDHLDFHGDMHAYAEAKARLFTPTMSARGFVEVDDDWGRWMATRATIPVVTVGRREADVHRRVVRADLGGTVALLEGPTDLLGGNRRVEVATPMLGDFNGHNAADALLAAVAVGTPVDDAVAGIAGCTGVPGRLERVEGGGDVTVLVDYAHTPDAITAVIDTIRRVLPPAGRVVVVVGAGGDRDASKRPLMGSAAASADVAVLTSDNPRSEDPRAILDAVAAGAAGGRADLVLELDRRRAIAFALDRAQPGDVVVIAGKGHETQQVIGDRVEDFDDRLVAAELLGARVQPVEGAA